MTALAQLYRDSLSLLTDLYQLTMAYGYWKCGMFERQAVFNLVFRTAPFGGGLAVACGLANVVDFLERLRFVDDDLDYLATLTGSDGQPLFERGFLDYLRGWEFACDVDAIPEGTVVFAHEPLVRVSGPLLQCQLLETPLLTLLNFPTLVATKAARVCAAAEGDAVIEFGLRRAQGIDGGVAASRAAYVGGCHGTSNVLAGKLFDIPVMGTHAHSWVMAFDSELESFRTYAQAMPNNCVFLVDTYDTLAGVRHAAQVGRALREQGHKMVGVRLDSGDLGELSKQARRILDDAGHQDTAIVASSDLDEYAIEQYKRQGARINVWGVGTRLATAYDQPALNGVYKLSAIHQDDGWSQRLKLSEQPAKVTNPGIPQVRRFCQDGRFVADMVYDEASGIGDPPRLIDLETGGTFQPPAALAHEDLLLPIFRQGRPVYQPPPAAEARARTLDQLSRVDPGVRRLHDADRYQVGLEQRLHELKQRLMAEVRGEAKCS